MTTFNTSVVPGKSITVTTHQTRTIDNGEIEVKFEKTYHVGDFITLGKIVNITKQSIIIDKGPGYTTKFHKKFDDFAEKEMASEIETEFCLLYDPIEEVREYFRNGPAWHTMM